MLLTTFLPSAAAADWQEKKGDHFIVYYVKDENFAGRVSHEAESYYQRVASDLGYARYSDFWQWDNRVKIYIHADQNEFRKSTGQAEWSHGMASYSKKEIHTYAASEGFLDGILPHEITHLVFRDFVGTQGEIPMWLDEGIAQWEEPEKRAMAKKISRYLVYAGKDYHIQDLTTMNVQNVQDTEKVHFFYMQAISLVDYLIGTYGSRSFTEFCRALRDGKKFDDALRTGYPGSIGSLGELDAKWRKYAAQGEGNPPEIYKKGGA